MPSNSFQPNPDESILYRSQVSRAWPAVAWRVGGGILMVLIFGFFSFTIFTNLIRQSLEFYLSPTSAAIASDFLCMGLVPLLVVAWFVEDTIQAFKGELVLTDQRIWIKASPYCWSGEREIPVGDVQSIRYRRDGIFIRLKSSRKLQVHMFPDGKQIVNAYKQAFGKPGSY